MTSLFFNTADLELEFNSNGVYNLKLGSFELQNCCVAVEVDGLDCSPQEWQVDHVSDTAVALSAENDAGKWRLEFERSPKNNLSVRLSGAAAEEHREINLYPMRLPQLPVTHVLTQSEKMGGCSAVLTEAGKNQDFSCYYQLMLTEKGQTLQLSFPLKQRLKALFKGRVEGKNLVGLDAMSTILHYGKRDLETEALTLRVSDDGFKLMSDYADENIDCKKDFSTPQAPGWNSWDYYRWTISEEEVLKNARFIANDPVLSKHVKRIIVDDGWQYCYGEWEANPLFPNGMKYLADELTKLGFEPGLWIAPTIIEPHCRIAQLDYDMLAMGESGQPCLAYACMQRHGFVLDPTVEKSRKFIYDLFSRYADMGYKYFKLDFMGQTMKARQFADRDVPHSALQEKIMEPIYEAVKGKAAILGCNFHFEAGNSYVDSVRTGSDIHATWHAIRHNTVSVAARFWTQNKLWINDPDFSLCRGFDTSNDPDITRLLPSLVSITPEMTDAGACTSPLVDVNRQQLEILLSIVLAAAGARNLSDNMLRLNESGLDLARRTVSAETGAVALPLDLFESELPAVWLQEVKGKHRVLLINWTDEADEFVFDLNAYGIHAVNAVNFWNDQPVPLTNDRIETTLKPRSCLFAVVE